MHNLNDLISEERAFSATRQVSEPQLKAAIRVVEATGKFMEIAEKTMGTGYKGKSVSRPEYDRMKASHADAMEIIADGLAQAGDTTGAVELLRRNPRFALPRN